MILNPLEQTAEKWVFLQKKKFLQKMHIPAEKCGSRGGGHRAGNCRKLQEGCRAQESRTLHNFHKNVSKERDNVSALPTSPFAISR